MVRVTVLGSATLFYSHRPPPSEQDYDLGDRELLAVKSASEEVRHWLEGSEVPFLSRTDHRNLEYVKSATCLNAHQARWSLFKLIYNRKLSFKFD